jgi:hypothetical protein
VVRPLLWKWERGGACTVCTPPAQGTAGIPNKPTDLLLFRVLLLVASLH